MTDSHQGRVAVFGLLAALCAAPRLLPPFTIGHDSAWCMFAARRILEGGSLFIDVVDVNPPLVFYLFMIPAALVHWTGVGEALAFHGFVLVIVATSLALANIVARRSLMMSAEARWLAGCVLVYLLVAAPGKHFGQREHIMLLLFLPYATCVAARLLGDPPRTVMACVCGASAGVGLSLKPFFLLAPIVLQFWLLYRTRRPGMLLTWECVSAGGVVVAYGVHLVCLPDEFWHALRVAVDTYHGFEAPFGSIVTTPVFLEAMLVIVVALLCARASRGVGTVAALSGMAFLVGAIVQSKGWSYHYLPAITMGWLGAAMAWITWICRRSRPRLTGHATLTLLVFTFALAGTRLWWDYEPGSGLVHPAKVSRGLIDMAREIRAKVDDGRMLVLDTVVAPAFPLINYTGLEWGSRFCHLWPLPGIYGHIPPGTSPFPYHPPDERTEAEVYLLDRLIEDMQTKPADLILVKKPPMAFMRHPGFDVLQWALGDHRFAKLWKNYKSLGEAYGFGFYERRVQ